MTVTPSAPLLTTPDPVALYGVQRLDVPLWAPDVQYAAGYVVQQSGVQYSRNTTGVSAATWGADSSNWTAEGGVSSGLTSFQGRSTAAATLTKADVTGTGLAASDIGATVVGSTVPSANSASPIAGTSTQAARADHVHPQGTWTAADMGILAQAYDMANASAGTALTPAGTVFTVRLHVPIALPTVTNILLAVLVAGSTLTAGQCFASLFQGGTLLGTTADQSTAWASAAVPLKTMPISGGPVALAAGDAVVGFWYNGTTGPQMARSGVNAHVNGALTGNNSRFGTADTGKTTTPPSPLGAITAGSVAYWAGLS